MKSTGEPDAVKWFWKKVSLIRKMVFIFSKYIMIEIVTVSVLKGWNQKGECFPKPRRRQTFFEGESISRKMRYIKDKLSFFYFVCQFYDFSEVL